MTDLIPEADTDYTDEGGDSNESLSNQPDDNPD